MKTYILFNLKLSMLIYDKWSKINGIRYYVYYKHHKIIYKRKSSA